MRHWLKAFIASSVLAVGFLAREVTSGWWRLLVYAAAIAIVFAQNLWDVKPDRRVDKILKVQADLIFTSFFKSAKERVNAGERLPFRANIMVSRLTLWPLPWRRLEMVYTYATEPSDDDYAMSWPWPYGMCWAVLRSGRPSLFLKKAGPAGTYRITKAQAAATDVIHGLISLPIRSRHADSRGPRRRAVAVLNVDALSPDAAADLQEQFKKLKQVKEQSKLVDLVNAFGLYF